MIHRKPPVLKNIAPGLTIIITTKNNGCSIRRATNKSSRIIYKSQFYISLRKRYGIRKSNNVP